MEYVAVDPWSNVHSRSPRRDGRSARQPPPGQRVHRGWAYDPPFNTALGIADETVHARVTMLRCHPHINNVIDSDTGSRSQAATRLAVDSAGRSALQVWLSE